MPIDHSFEHTPSFRDLTQTGLLLMSRPLVRTLREMKRLRRGQHAIQVPIAVRTSKPLRRIPLPGSR